MAAFFTNHTFPAGASVSPQTVADWSEWIDGPADSLEHENIHLVGNSGEECAPLSPRTRSALDAFFGPVPTCEALLHSRKSLPSPAENLAVSMSAETASSACANANGEEEELIWRLTQDYLRGLRTVCEKAGEISPSVLAARLSQSISSGDTLKSRQLPLVLQAIDLAAESSMCDLSVPRDEKTASNSVFRLNPSASFPLNSLPKSFHSQEIRVIPKAKTGRKPEKYCCFLCQTVFPYKKNLIHHIQVDHGISRCQSLLYKRLKQGEEQFKRLYVEESECL